VLLSGALLVGGLLAGCGGEDTGDALDVPLDGFHPAADRPTPTTLCAPDPADTSYSAPGLPAALGAVSDAASFVSAPAALDAFSWRAEDAAAARAVVAGATTAASACTWTSSSDHDLDGDGVAETPGSEVQEAGEWSSEDWSGLRITRTVAGTEQVDLRLVADGETVLLVVMQVDSDDPGDLAPADEYLAAVAERLD
jgi:hypothetical protein